MNNGFHDFRLVWHARSDLKVLRQRRENELLQEVIKAFLQRIFINRMYAIWTVLLFVSTWTVPGLARLLLANYFQAFEDFNTFFFLMLIWAVVAIPAYIYLLRKPYWAKKIEYVTSRSTLTAVLVGLHDLIYHSIEYDAYNEYRRKCARIIVDQFDDLMQVGSPRLSKMVPECLVVAALTLTYINREWADWPEIEELQQKVMGADLKFNERIVKGYLIYWRQWKRDTEFTRWATERYNSSIDGAR